MDDLATLGGGVVMRTDEMAWRSFRPWYRGWVASKPSQPESVTDEECSGGHQPIVIEDAVVLHTVGPTVAPNQAAMDTGMLHAPQAATLMAVSASASAAPSRRTSISGPPPVGVRPGATS